VVVRRLGILAAVVAIAVAAAVVPPGTTTVAQPQCYSETGFCISNPAFQQYFNDRGAIRILGYPVSRSFILEGFEVQFFQRVILQMNQGSVARLNVLDPGIMPMTRANASIFPDNDPGLAAAAPQVGSPTYANDVVNFVRQVSPDTWNGLNVGFFTLFNTTVPAPPGTSPDTVTLLNLEIWGLPTSHPAADPNNPTFVYQRFQRGIMHHRASVPATEGILVADYLKSVITNQNLPPDLAVDMRNSRFFAQYAPGAPNWVARPAELQNTDLTNAFEPGTGTAPVPLPQPTPAPGAPAATATITPTPVADAPTISTFRVDDEQIDPGDSVQVTIIARDDDGVDWIQFEGRFSDNDNGNANDNVNDSAFDRQEFDCDNQTECAKVFDISPNTSGEFTLRARARDTEGNESEWSEIELDVRSGGATATPTATSQATATTAPAATATTAPAATPTQTPGPAPKP
jgi:hypothetical protein